MIEIIKEIYKYFIYKKKIYIILKLLILYFALLVLFYKNNNNKERLVGTIIIYGISIIIFNLSIIHTILYFILAIACVITESIYMNFFEFTWEYKKSDLISVPYWLVPLWATAIIFITQVSNIITTLPIYPNNTIISE